MSELKIKIDYLNAEIKIAMDKFTNDTGERIWMIDIYKDENDGYIVKPILGEPEFSEDEI